MIAGAATAHTIQGRYFAAEDNRSADAPLHVSLSGMGAIRGIGRAKLSGFLDLGGFHPAGRPDVSGTLTLTNARGTLTLRLTGSGGSADVPDSRLVTTVSGVKGTGAYAGVRHHGTVAFQFGPNQILSFAAHGPIGGQLTVTLRLRPVVK
jgi:hypothetical protein